MSKLVKFGVFQSFRRYLVGISARNSAISIIDRERTEREREKGRAGGKAAGKEEEEGSKLEYVFHSLMRESANEIAPRRLVCATTADCSGWIQISLLSLSLVYVAQSSTRVPITFPLYLPFLCARRFYYRALKLARVKRRPGLTRNIRLLPCIAPIANLRSALG